MSITIVTVLVFSVVLVCVNPKNKYNFYFVFMMFGIAISLIANIIEVAKSSNYLLPQDYIFRNIENSLYLCINGHFRLTLSKRMIIHNVGIVLYLAACNLFALEFCNSVRFRKKEEKKFWKKTGLFLILLFLAVYFCFYHPATAYRVYNYGYKLEGGRAVWFRGFIGITLFMEIISVVVLFFPIAFLALHYKQCKGTLFAKQIIGLILGLGLLNSLFLKLFLVGDFRFSAISVVSSGLWRYSIPPVISVFYIIYMPMLMIAVEVVLLGIIVRFNVSRILFIFYSKILNKNMEFFYRTQKDLLHSNKNMMLQFKILAEEGIEQFGQEISQLMIIRDLCDANMQAMSRQNESMRQVNIRRTKHDYIETLETAIKEVVIPENVILQRDYDKETIFGFYDEYFMKQVFLNLLDNALDAMALNGENKNVLKVTLRQTEKWTYCAVADTGTGISFADTKRIFAPYFSTKNRKENWGLGLSYVQRIIIAHGGFIGVQKKPKEYKTIVEFIVR